MIFTPSVCRRGFVFLALVLIAFGMHSASALQHPFEFEEGGYTFRPVMTEEMAQQIVGDMPCFGFLNDDGDFDALNEYIRRRNDLAADAPAGISGHLIHPWVAWQEGRARAWFVFNKPSHVVQTGEGLTEFLPHNVVAGIYSMTLPLLDGYPSQLPVHGIEMGFASDVHPDHMRELYRAAISYLAHPWIDEEVAVAPFPGAVFMQAGPVIERYAGVVFPFRNADLESSLAVDPPEAPEDEDDDTAYSLYRHALEKWVQRQVFHASGLQMPENCLFAEEDAEGGDGGEGGEISNAVPHYILSLDSASRNIWRAHLPEEMAARLQAYVARIQAPLHAARAQAEALEAERLRVEAEAAEEAARIEAERLRIENIEVGKEYRRLASDVRLKAEATEAAGQYSREHQHMLAQERHAGLPEYLCLRFNLPSMATARALVQLVIEGYVGDVEEDGEAREGHPTPGSNGDLSSSESLPRADVESSDPESE